MANLVITSTTNTVSVEFNDYTTSSGIKKGIWHKERIIFQLMPSDAFVKVLVLNEASWSVSFNGSTGTLQIDTVDTVAPVSNSDLYIKLVALLG